MGRRGSHDPLYACVQQHRPKTLSERGQKNVQHEFIRAGPVSRRAILCRDTVELELRHHLSCLALALELCPLPVPGLADWLCLLELLVEGAGMNDRSVPISYCLCVR